MRNLAGRTALADERLDRRAMDRLLADIEDRDFDREAQEHADAARVRVTATTGDDWTNWPLVDGGQGRSGSDAASSAGQFMLILAVLLLVMAIGFGMTSQGFLFTLALLSSAACATLALGCGWGESGAVGP